jgi:hypothetical protein
MPVETPVSYSPFPAFVALRSTYPTKIVQECLKLPPVAGVSGMDLHSLHVQYLAHDDHQNFNFLFRLR